MDPWEVWLWKWFIVGSLWPLTVCQFPLFLTSYFLCVFLLSVNSTMLEGRLKKIQTFIILNNTFNIGLPWWRSGWESACQCRGHGFEPWSGKIPHAAEQLAPWVTITEPACHNYWSPCASSLCSPTGDTTAMRGLCITMKSSPCLQQLEKALAQKRRANTAINKLIIKM